MQYKQHASVDAVLLSEPEDTSLGACSDDSVDIDMEKLKAEAKEVACVTFNFYMQVLRVTEKILCTDVVRDN